MRTSAAAAVMAGGDDATGEGRIGERDLIVALVERAAQDGLTGQQLARKIGIDQALLVRARRTGPGRERLGIVTCAKIVRVYPELSDHAAAYLADAHGWPIVRALAMLGKAADQEQNDPD
jgi:hypothetical protein